MGRSTAVSGPASRRGRSRQGWSPWTGNGAIFQKNREHGRLRGGEVDVAAAAAVAAFGATTIRLEQAERERRSPRPRKNTGFRRTPALCRCCEPARRARPFFNLLRAKKSWPHLTSSCPEGAGWGRGPDALQRGWKQSTRQLVFQNGRVGRIPPHQSANEW